MKIKTEWKKAGLIEKINLILLILILPFLIIIAADNWKRAVKKSTLNFSTSAEQRAMQQLPLQGNTK